MAIRIYEDILIPANLPSQYTDIAVPAGTWRVTSLMALASIGGTVTGGVETIIALNQAERLKASEHGAVEPIISGGPMRTTATRKGAVGDIFVRVIMTLEPY